MFFVSLLSAMVLYDECALEEEEKAAGNGADRQAHAYAEESFESPADEGMTYDMDTVITNFTGSLGGAFLYSDGFCHLAGT